MTDPSTASSDPASSDAASSDSPPVLVVANPKSGGGLAGELVPYLAAELQRRDFPVEVFLSSAAGQITERVRLVRGPYTALIVTGGDGTMREVLKGRPSPDLPIGLLPAGTANVLAAERGFPYAPADTAAMVADGNSELVDVGFLDAPDPSRREPFLLMVGSGIDARIVKDVDERRKGGVLGKLRYVGSMVRSVVRYAPGKHWFVLENGDRYGPYEQLLVANVSSYGGFWKMPGKISMTDGLLDCIGFTATGAGGILKAGVRGAFNRLREGRDVVHHQAARVRIESEDPGPLQIDGDPGGLDPVEIGIEHKALRLLVPRSRLTGNRETEKIDGTKT